MSRQATVEKGPIEQINPTGASDPQPPVDEAATNVDVVIANRPPTVEMQVTQGEGRTPRRVEVLAPETARSLPAAGLRGEARGVFVKPASGHVLVQDAKGQILARFHTREQALGHLRAVKVELGKIAGSDKLEVAKKK